MKKVLSLIISIILAFSFCGCVLDDTGGNASENSIVSIEEIPDFNGMAYIKINNGVPQFTENEITTDSYEKYAALDYLGRCGVAMACVGKELMPTEERGEIGMVKPTGWHTVKYDVVDGKYLYNRCHLIGFQLTGENANEQNLITGTRFLNIEGMLPFENMIADYIKETGNHVMYRVTPIFESINLLCKGVQMEGYSVEDEGDGILFNVFAYNAQPQVEINYLTGESRLLSGMLPEDDTSSWTTSYKSKETSQITNSEEGPQPDTSTIYVPDESEQSPTADDLEYIANKNSKKIHLNSCGHAKNIKEENKLNLKGNLNDHLKNGYTKCQVCLKDD